MTNPITHQIQGNRKTSKMETKVKCISNMPTRRVNKKGKLASSKTLIMESIESMELMDWMESMELMELMESMELMELMELMESMELMELMESME